MASGATDAPETASGATNAPATASGATDAPAMASGATDAPAPPAEAGSSAAPVVALGPGARGPQCPRAADPWAPPAQGLPPSVADAAATLFSQGLADPRGCAYHEVDVEVGSVWTGPDGVLTTHGWVMPASGSGPRLAVLANGLVYPLVRVGGAADLAADVAQMAAQPRRLELAEREHAAASSLRVTTVALLLRLGEGNLAEDVWNAWAGQRAPQQVPADPYVAMAQEWVWALFDHALGAHMRGDDATAMATATELAPLLVVVEAEADARGIPRIAAQGRLMPHVDFAAPAAELLSDQLRRASVTRTAADLAAARRLAPPARAVALVAWLDEVAARQDSQPGSVRLAREPLVQELVALGPAAAPALLAALRNDERLTRSVEFARDFKRHRYVLHVYDVAYAALAAIVGGPVFDDDDTRWRLRREGPVLRAQIAARIAATPP